MKSRKIPFYFLCVLICVRAKAFALRIFRVCRPRLAAAADPPLLSSWVCWSLAASHRLAWQHIEHGDDRWRAAALRPVAGSCGRRAPEGLMDSKDLLVLAASVMRSKSLIAHPSTLADRHSHRMPLGARRLPAADSDRRATAALPHWASAPRRRSAGAVPLSPRAVGGRHGHVPAALILLVLNLDNSSESVRPPSARVHSLRAPLHTQLAGTLPCTIARVARRTPPSVQPTAPPAIMTQAWSAG